MKGNETKTGYAVLISLAIGGFSVDSYHGLKNELEQCKPFIDHAVEHSNHQCSNEKTAQHLLCNREKFDLLNPR